MILTQRSLVKSLHLCDFGFFFAFNFLPAHPVAVGDPADPVSFIVKK
jgi:hypothetical protein